MRLSVLALLILVWSHPADAKDGLRRAAHRAAQSETRSEWLDCSVLPDPSVSSFNVTTASGDLHTFATSNCASGCILNLSPGTYSDTNITFGTNAADSAVKVGSIATLGGEVLIRAADPSNKPVLRTALGSNKAAVIHATNQTARIRLENLILDGRRSEQTNANLTAVCTDTSPANGICDSGGATPKSTGTLHGFISRSTLGGVTQSCLSGVEVRNTAQTAIAIRNAVSTTVQDGRVDGAGCTSSLCPGFSLPAAHEVNATILEGQGIQFTASEDVDAVRNAITSVTKIGLECIGGVRRCGFHYNTVDTALNAGVVLNESDGKVVGNRISDTGLWLPFNATTDNNGIGILYIAGDSTAALAYSSVIEGNTVSNTFGSGIQVGLSSPTTRNMAVFRVDRNAISGACNGTTRTDSAGLEVGDSSLDFSQVLASGNSIIGADCPDGLRVRNLVEYEDRGSSVTGGVEVDGVDQLWLYRPNVNGTIDIDSASRGKLELCTLVGSIVGGANVSRVFCS